jgi:hypothetical protein
MEELHRAVAFLWRGGDRIQARRSKVDIYLPIECIIIKTAFHQSIDLLFAGLFDLKVSNLLLALR